MYLDNNNVWNKNNYYNLESKDSNYYGNSKSIISYIITGMFLILLLISLWNLGHKDYIKTHIVKINSSSKLLHEISDKFLSFSLDSSWLRDMETIPLKNESFINLAKHLSPAFLRIGGTSADCLFFNESLPFPHRRIPNPLNQDEDISNFTITEEDYLSIYKFAKKANLRLMFDLNALIRSHDNKWNSSNARKIINYSKAHNMDLDWQLGNEPNSYRHKFNRSVTAYQLGEDYYHLRMLLNVLGFNSSILVGPEANHIGDPSHRGDLYVEKFLEGSKNSIDYVTWHQYYLDGHVATLEDFINPEVLNRLSNQINLIQTAINNTKENIQMWISETSSAYGGGAFNLSDRFVAGFLWLDKLGYSAKSGVNVVIRQALDGGYYSLVSTDLQPNPDWWISILYKQFVSNKVINFKPPNNLGKLRLYAHCTLKNALINRVPSITIFGVNIDNQTVRISLQGNFSRKNAKVFLYILTASNLLSKEILLNDKVLNLNNDGSLPEFKPVIIDSSQIITVPKYSLIFMVIHGIKIEACIT